MSKEEEIIHKQICQYIRTQWPHPIVIFSSEPSGLRLPIGQAKKLKALRSGPKLPDLWILEPRWGFAGLLIEIKTEDANMNTPHVKEQAELLKILSAKGYEAVFGIGFDKTKEIVDRYLKGNYTITNR